jgi:hypothetical protein
MRRCPPTRIPAAAKVSAWQGISALTAHAKRRFDEVGIMAATTILSGKMNRPNRPRGRAAMRKIRKRLPQKGNLVARGGLEPPTP